MSKSKKSMEEMNKHLNKFKQNTTPSSIIMSPSPDDIKNTEQNETKAKTNDSKEKTKNISLNKELSQLIQKKQKVEDTHTRRTFHVENELLEILDRVAEQNKNTGFKKEFINYAIRQALEQLGEL